MNKILNTDAKPKISILVPVYNTAIFLRECLDSLVNQTLKDIEIIGVDDGSTDESHAILEEYRQNDPRIKIIARPQNEGLMRARYYGIDKACGKYILFVDSDDFLAENACEISFAAIEKYGVDILHFSAETVSFGTVSSNKIAEIKSYITPYVKRLSGSKIFASCFAKSKFGWNLWNKIYRTSVVKKTLKYFPDNHCVLGEDMFIFSMISSFAESYCGIRDILYTYRLGSGVSTTYFTEKQFSSLASKITALHNMKDFFDRLGLYDGFRKKFVENEIAAAKLNMTNIFLNSVPTESAAKCFDIMVQSWGIEETLERIMDNFDNYSLAKKLNGSATLAPHKKKIKNIALFYFDYGGNGGVERVMSKLIVLLHDLNYKVTLIVEERSKQEFILPSYCRLHVISSSRDVDGRRYMNHFRELRQIMDDDDIDLVLYQASNSSFMLGDLIAVKSKGIYFVASIHDFITSPLLYRGQSFSWKPLVLKLCDAVQTITSLEETVYRREGIRAHFIPNPPTFDVAEGWEKTFTEKNVIWVGRLDDVQKNPREALEIIAQVKEYVPDIHLTVLGHGNEAENKRFDKYIKCCGLTDNVKWIKYTEETEKYYKVADMMLVTSSFEVYPMALGEAMSFGLPIVTYEMPYVELLKENCAGSISVEPHNTHMAALAIIDILNNDEQRKKMNCASKQAITRISSGDLKNMWAAFIARLPENTHRLSPSEEDDISVFLRTVREHYHDDKYHRQWGKPSIVANLFRYFSKFGFRVTVKKICCYIRKNGLRAALAKGRRSIA